MKPIDPLPDRLAREAVRLRKQAEATPYGVDRDVLIIRARQIEEAAAVYRAMRPK
jgi:hypothetical protein